ncbi:MAG: hypothetical protein OXL97_06915 [Chloroflexota bacterium]|nr:hypothetical protein [Chloroflexota bacterium]MDE2883677.1 hypothetical protein [Chloroflexota bacterium]
MELVVVSFGVVAILLLSTWWCYRQSRQREAKRLQEEQYAKMLALPCRDCGAPPGIPCVGEDVEPYKPTWTLSVVEEWMAVSNPPNNFHASRYAPVIREYWSPSEREQWERRQDLAEARTCPHAQCNAQPGEPCIGFEDGAMLPRGRYHLYRDPEQFDQVVTINCPVCGVIPGMQCYNDDYTAYSAMHDERAESAQERAILSSLANLRDQDIGVLRCRTCNIPFTQQAPIQQVDCPGCAQERRRGFEGISKQPCNDCGAVPGMPCKDDDGNVLIYAWHLERYRRRALNLDALDQIALRITCPTCGAAELIPCHHSDLPHAQHYHVKRLYSQLLEAHHEGTKLEFVQLMEEQKGPCFACGAWTVGFIDEYGEWAGAATALPPVAVRCNSCGMETSESW